MQSVGKHKSYSASLLAFVYRPVLANQIWSNRSNGSKQSMQRLCFYVYAHKVCFSKTGRCSPLPINEQLHRIVLPIKYGTWPSFHGHCPGYWIPSLVQGLGCMGSPQCVQPEKVRLRQYPDHMVNIMSTFQSGKSLSGAPSALVCCSRRLHYYRIK